MARVNNAAQPDAARRARRRAQGLGESRWYAERSAVVGRKAAAAAGTPRHGGDLSVDADQLNLVEQIRLQETREQMDGNGCSAAEARTSTSAAARSWCEWCVARHTDRKRVYHSWDCWRYSFGACVINHSKQQQKQQQGNARTSGNSTAARESTQSVRLICSATGRRIWRGARTVGIGCGHEHDRFVADAHLAERFRKACV